MKKLKLIGPFSQILTMDKLPLRGSLSDEQLEIISDGGILYQDGRIEDVGDYETLKANNPNAHLEIINQSSVCFPGLIDVHTHICWAGTRANDYAMRLNGKSYLEIAEAGGGIWSTVLNTRKASLEDLTQRTIEHANALYEQGITTIEVKSGYGLTVEDELKMLRAIKEANKHTAAELVPTCLAAHMKPRDFEGTNREYLQYIIENLLPKVKEEGLAKRVDIFTEKSAFSVEDSQYYLFKAKELGFEITIHGDQFSNNVAALAVETDALSIDHLEYADEKEIEILSNGNTVAVALPGASIGLGEPYTPARKLLDAGCSLAIATDWNPGSAPMGNLLVQAAVLGTTEKLSMAETWAAMTVRAAKALNRSDIGVLKKGMKANFAIFPTDNFREILYRQGQMQASLTIS